MQTSQGRRRRAKIFCNQDVLLEEKVTRIVTHIAICGFPLCEGF